MSLSKEDKKEILAWFEAKKSCINNGTNLESVLDDYYKYRDKICEKLLKNLEDLFAIKKFEWKHKYGITSEDSESIIHDAILMSIDNFKTGKIDFITYFWHVLNNRVKVFLSLYKAKCHNPGKPLSSIEYLSDIFGSCGRNRRSHSYSAELISLLYNYLVNEHRKESSILDSKFFVQFILKKLTEQERFIVKSILRGDLFTEIADALNISKTTVTNRINSIKKKLKYLEKVYE